MVDTSRFSALLAEKGLRLTRQRESVAEAIVDAKGAFTAQELHDSLRASASDVGLTTVYRTLEILSQAGVVERVHGLRGCEAFVVAGRSHSHTIVCSSWAPPRARRLGCEELVATAARQTGFRINDHVIQLSGICARCAVGERSGDV